MYEGYCETKTLPYKRGQMVTILRGTTLRSKHPQKKGPYAATRKQTVKIHHFGCGSTLSLGTEYVDPDGTTKFYCLQRQKDVAHYGKRLGYEGDTWKPAFIEWLRSKCVRVQRGSGNYDGKVYDLKLHYENPTVCWPGTGGYWIEADINDVLPKSEG